MKKKRKILLIGQYTFVALSCIWGVIAVCGFFTFGWIGYFSTLTPAELVVQLGALAFPICIFYLLGSYIDRNQLATFNIEASKAYLEELVYPSELGAQYVQDLNSELKQQIQTFKSSFEGVTDQTKQVREDLESWIDALNLIIAHMGDQTQRMASYVQQLNEATTAAQEQSANAGHNLATQADILLKVTDETQKALFESTKSLQGQTEEIKQNMHAVTQAEKNIGQALDKSSKLVSQLTENACKIEKSMDATNTMQEYLSDTNKVLLRFKEIGATLDMRLKALKENKMPEKESANISVGVSAKEFTKCMQDILDQLQGLSVEMTSVFELKNEEALWEQYYAGDKTIFMRQIKNILSQTKRQKMLDTALLDEGFQENVSKYKKTFEELTRGLENSPWLGVLVGSDAGRLYMVLANLFKGDKNASKIG